MIPVEKLFTIRMEAGTPVVLRRGPQGTRGIVMVTGGSFEGPRLSGTVLPGGGEWATLRANRSAKADVRLLLETADGAHILMTYTGISLDSAAKVRVAPLFETGDERYAWLNDVQGVGIGHMEGNVVTYDMYALL
ncbi:hypothetical protein AYO38_01815 [bacterium SCGC AG-212-C10]|nr:hypothetical protein AYO38_01815 [bacterium SCGC AG-212-C10]